MARRGLEVCQDSSSMWPLWFFEPEPRKGACETRVKAKKWATAQNRRPPPSGHAVFNGQPIFRFADCIPILAAGNARAATRSGTVATRPGPVRHSERFLRVSQGSPLHCGPRQRQTIPVASRVPRVFRSRTDASSSLPRRPNTNGCFVVSTHKVVVKHNPRVSNARGRSGPGHVGVAGSRIPAEVAAGTGSDHDFLYGGGLRYAAQGFGPPAAC